MKFDNTFSYVYFLLEKLDFPSSTASDVKRFCEKIAENEQAAEKFCEIVKRYSDSKSCDFMKMSADMKEVSRSAGIHEYAGDLILYLALGEKMKDYYAEKGISDEIYYNTLCDLRYKCEECRLVYGVCGNFTVGWFPGFFALTRFALGRLQFELVKLPMDCEIDGVKLASSSPAINVHIPRTGDRLYYDQVKSAYRAAAHFFRDAFVDTPIIFGCHSWLLYPWNLEVLSPSSNLYAFCSDFTVIRTENYSDYSEIWRLFDCKYTGDASALPRDSSLRRAYADRIERGEPLGHSLGVFIFKE